MAWWVFSPLPVFGTLLDSSPPTQPHLFAGGMLLVGMTLAAGKIWLSAISSLLLLGSHFAM